MAAGADGDALAKALGRPSLYNGDADQWEEWSFVFRSYLILKDLTSENDLATLETLNGSVLNVDLGPVHEPVEASLLRVSYGDQGYSAAYGA